MFFRFCLFFCFALFSYGLFCSVSFLSLFLFCFCFVLFLFVCFVFCLFVLKFAKIKMSLYVPNTSYCDKRIRYEYMYMYILIELVLFKDILHYKIS